MFLLGHTGIGATLAQPFTRPGTKRWVLLGCVLPDLIDKPLYYGLSFATGRRGAELGLISGTRTVGHTLLLLLLVWLASRVLRRRAFAFVALGMATHLLLDALGDYVPHGGGPVPSLPGGPPTIAAIFWPLLGWQFPIMPFKNVAEHLGSVRNWYVIAGEAIGLPLVVAHAWLWRRRLRDARAARLTAPPP